MKKSAYIFLAAAALFAAASCESEIRPDEELPVDDGILCFLPTLDGVHHAELDSASDPASQTKVADLVSDDGSIAVPLICEVVDGIADQAANDGAPQTKGDLLNTTSDWKDLGTYVSKFYVAAWQGSTSFVPAYKEVTKATPLWKTSDTYRWGPTEEATFYAYANLPASGATATATSGEQLLTYIVPTASSAQQDILMGYYSGYSKFSSINNGAFHKGGVSEVKFYHPLTSVRFKKGTFEGYAADKVKFKSISIVGVYISGTAVMNPTTMGETDPGKKFNWTASKTATQKVTMSPASGTYLTVDDDNFIGDAFLLIPQTMTTSNSVKITVKVDLDGTEKDFDAKLTSNTWAAGKTNVYTLGYDDPNI